MLSGGGGELSDPNGSDLEFFATTELRPLVRLEAPPDCWAVDGGQALVADARCLQVAATRAARTRWQGGRCTLEEVGDMAVHVLTGSGGGPEGRRSLSEMGAPTAPGAPVDLNLLRDWSEWRLVATSVEEAEPGAIVLVDGDLQPDWRIPAQWLADLLTRAAERDVALVGIIKHSSLARGGAPLVGQLELEAEAALGAARLLVGACRDAPPRGRPGLARRRGPPRPRRPVRVPHRPPGRRRCGSAPRAAERPRGRRWFPGLPLPALTSRPPGSLPGLGARRGVGRAAERPRRRRFAGGRQGASFRRPPRANGTLVSAMLSGMDDGLWSAEQSVAEQPVPEQSVLSRRP